MKAKLHQLDCDGINEPLEDFVPPDAEDVDLLLTAYIGSDEVDGRDIFYLQLLTPKSLARRLWAKRYVWERALILERYDYKLLMSLVRSLCDRVEGDTWEDIADALTKHMGWEFERNTETEVY